jgi:hypothetical protein
MHGTVQKWSEVLYDFVHPEMKKCLMRLFFIGYTRGIQFGNGIGVKLTTSHRDLLLILGIVVAIIISVTTWLRDSDSKSSRITPPPSPKANSSQVIKKLGQAVFKLTSRAF